MIRGISKRIGCIISHIPECDLLIDIGTDHGYVPVGAIEEGKCKEALGCDIGEGPLERAAVNIRSSGYEDRIKLVLSDGFTGIDPGMIKGRNICAVITGMGGMEIIKILEGAEKTAVRAETNILSPQSNIPELREFLRKNGYVIKSEFFLKDGKFYDIMTVVSGHMELTEEDRLFGRNIEAECKDEYSEYISFRKNEFEKILESLDVSGGNSDRRQEIEHCLSVLLKRSREYEA